MTAGRLDGRARRSLSIVIVLIMAAAPAAVDLCQLTCADMAVSQASHPEQDHTACHHPDGAQGLHLAPTPHPCDHGDGLPAPTVSTVDTHPALSLGAAVTGLCLTLLPRADLAPADVHPPRPLEIRLARPLRI